MFFQMDCPKDLVTHTIINVTYYEACSHVMYIYIINESMHHLPFINNAGPLMPFIKSCSSNIKQIFFWPINKLQGKPETAQRNGSSEKKNHESGVHYSNSNESTN